MLVVTQDRVVLRVTATRILVLDRPDVIADLGLGTAYPVGTACVAATGTATGSGIASVTVTGTSLASARGTTYGQAIIAPEITGEDVTADTGSVQVQRTIPGLDLSSTTGHVQVLRTIPGADLTSTDGTSIGRGAAIAAGTGTDMATATASLSGTGTATAFVVGTDVLVASETVLGIGSAMLSATGEDTSTATGTVSAFQEYFATVSGEDLSSATEPVLASGTTDAPVSGSDLSIAQASSPASGSSAVGVTGEDTSTATGTVDTKFVFSVSGTDATTTTGSTSESGTATNTVSGTDVTSATGTVTASAPVTSYTITLASSAANGATHTDFPMLFSYTNANLKTVANGGSVVNANHIRFATDAAGTSLLKWQIISYGATTGTVVAIVKIPSYSHTTNTVIYIAFDDNGVTTFQGDVNATWDSAFKSVTTFGDGSTLDLTDATSNGNNGTQNGGVTAIAGPNGLGAGSFNSAVPQYVTTTNVMNITQPTIEALVYIPSLPSGRSTVVGFSNGYASGTADKALAINSSGTVTIFIWDGGGEVITSTGTLSTGTWYHLAVTANGTTAKLFINGTQDGSIACGNTFTGYSTNTVHINGVSLGGVTSVPLTDRTSMVRISNIARSDAWIATQATTLLSPSSIYTVS